MYTLNILLSNEEKKGNERMNNFLALTAMTSCKIVQEKNEPTKKRNQPTAEKVKLKTLSYTTHVRCRFRNLYTRNASLSPPPHRILSIYLNQCSYSFGFAVFFASSTIFQFITCLASYLYWCKLQMKTGFYS